MQKRQILLLGILSFFVFVVWYHVFAGRDVVHTSDVLTVAYLDIGQGDAIYIEAPNGHQMIIDGGPNETLMSALPPVMPMGDMSIDVMMVTNPDLDHYSGFLPLLDAYDVGAVVEPGTTNEFSMYGELEKKIREEGAEHILARKGETIMLDPEHSVYFEILFPDRNVSTWKSNDGSIIGRLVYGDTSFLFTGDATMLAEALMLSGSDVSGTDVLKVGHHGSKTSTGDALLREASPALAIISAGKGNRYGHPSPVVTDRLARYGIPYLVTMNEGTIILTSDGMTVTRKK